MAEHGEPIPEPQTLSFYVQHTNQIFSGDILANVIIDTPELAWA
jgi:hypothetical protein